MHQHQPDYRAHLLPMWWPMLYIAAPWHTRFMQIQAQQKSLLSTSQINSEHQQCANPGVFTQPLVERKSEGPGGMKTYSHLAAGGLEQGGVEVEVGGLDDAAIIQTSSWHH
jgi:hypothetical protein